MVENKPPVTFNFAVFMAMLYVTFDITSMAMTYKIFTFHHIIISGASLIFPLTYVMSDIIAEVYGYEFAKKTIWCSFFCDLVFALITLCIAALHTNSAVQQHSYWYVFSGLLRAFFAELVAVISGIFVNIYVISRLKVLTMGRYFWLRSIGSSAVGELVLVVVGVPLMFLGPVALNGMFDMIAVDYIYKLVFAVVMSFPATIIANFLKERAGGDVFDLSTNFNPFKMS